MGGGGKEEDGREKGEGRGREEGEGGEGKGRRWGSSFGAGGFGYH